MRVAIITFHSVNNYGAVLQAYALSQYLQQLNVRVDIVNYKPLGQMLFYAIWNLTGGSPERAQHKMLRNFLYKTTHVTNATTLHVMLGRQLKKYDLIICGSDEIWNVHKWYIGFDSAYFLDNAPRPAMRVSYAPSAGEPKNLTLKEKKRLSELIEKFSHVSVRDSNTELMLRSSGYTKPVSLVVDPTFLINWDKMIEPVEGIPIKYILLYSYKNLNQTERDFIKKLSKNKNCPVLDLRAGAPWLHGKSLTPGQWLFIFQNASFVITSAFHGVVFSLIFKRQWIALRKKGKQEKIEDLCNSIGLSDRHILIGNSHESIHVINTEVKYPLRSLEQKIISSKQFLKNSLQSI